MWVMVGVLKIVELVGDVLEVTAAANNGFYVRRELSVMIVVVEEDGGRWRKMEGGVLPWLPQVASPRHSSEREGGMQCGHQYQDIASKMY